jgi:hypothetical protein
MTNARERLYRPESPASNACRYCASLGYTVMPGACLWKRPIETAASGGSERTVARNQKNPMGCQQPWTQSRLQAERWQPSAAEAWEAGGATLASAACHCPGRDPAPWDGPSRRSAAVRLRTFGQLRRGLGLGRLPSRLLNGLAGTAPPRYRRQPTTTPSGAASSEREAASQGRGTRR